MSKLVIEGLSHFFGSLCVVEKLNLAVDAGEFLAIVGPSGCGKSTLLRLMAGLVTPIQGRVIIDDVEVKGPNPRHNMVFQDHALYPWRTVFQNVALRLEIQRLHPAAIREKVESLLSLVGLERFPSYYPHQLSGGMRQRVALARALAVDPDVLFLDEPFGALDAMTRLVLQNELLKLWLDSGKTVVLVTHDVDEALFLADRIIVMSALPGRVRETLRVTEPRPRDRGSMALAPVKRRILKILGLESAIPRARLPVDFDI